MSAAVCPLTATTGALAVFSEELAAVALLLSESMAAAAGAAAVYVLVAVAGFPDFFLRANLEALAPCCLPERWLFS